MPYKPLSRLSVNDVSLAVHVTEMDISYNHDMIRDLRGNVFTINVPAEIRGCFTADSVNNSIADIQNCLSNPFNQNSILDYNDRLYDIFITGMKWGVDPLRDEEDAVFGHFLQYQCTFIANRRDREVPVQPESNVVMWDVYVRQNYVVRDLRELVGTDDLESVATKAVALIDKYAKYRATADCPTPSFPEGAGSSDDVAAVLAGSKPAAIFDESCLGREEMLPLLIQEVSARGMQVETVDHFGTQFSQTRSIVVGIPYHVRQIVQIISQAVRDNVVSDYYYERLGELTGMPRESTHRLLSTMRDFGFNRA